MELQLQRVVTNDNLFSHLGRITGVFWSPDRSMVAIASTLNYLFWPARAIYGGNKFGCRLSLYRLDPLRLVAMEDRPLYPVHDVVFHPRRSSVAIATGSYDGGYLFEGELLLWDWETNNVTSLLETNVEVLRCRFSGDGTELTILTHPPDEGDFEGDAFRKYYVHESLRLDDGKHNLKFDKPVDPIEHGFQIGVTTEPHQEMRVLCERYGLQFEERSHVWDVLWMEESVIGCVSRESVFEVWHLDGTRTFREESPAQYGAELARGTQGEILINAPSRYPSEEASWLHPTTLMGYDRANSRLYPLREFQRCFTVSYSENGYLLVREVEYHSRKKREERLYYQGKFSKPLRLGHYDCFNHYVRINGTEQLFFLQGDPPDQHENKYLCSLDAGTKKITRHWPVEWDDNRKAHLMNGCACICSNIFLCSFQIFHQAIVPFDGFIAGRTWPEGAILWSTPVAAQVTTMLPLDPMRGVVFYALVNGEIGLIQSQNGKKLFTSMVMVNEVPSCVISADVQGQSIAAGTIDGRVLLYDFIS